ncbi:hypothetical protein BV898_08050 [Hypsibius exemplaris]|uniref:Uncharacterized protein n=1 Tax=Hypsibius exemplaris TaxID=2072580 RepID=A0A1W0WRU1_HYPEX|nr:hypothetical protein BV898_08050 [Hypsibius exemplaris]
MSCTKATFLLVNLGLVFAALPTNIQSQTAEAKHEILWKKAPYLTHAFTNAGDEMEEGRKQLLHPLGTIGKVQLNIFSTSTYSGVFQPGALSSARLSWARFDYSYIMPGVGLKYFIDGQPSQNFHLMQDLEGFGPERNFFISHPTNCYPNPKSFAIRMVAKVFDAGVALLPGGVKDADRPEATNALGLYEQAAVTSNGKKVAKVVAPYRLELVPNAAVGKVFEGRDADDFRTVLGDIPVGTPIYDVMAQRETAESKAEFIGQIVTQSAFVASAYGDKKLYLQHASKRWQK